MVRCWPTLLVCTALMFPGRCACGDDAIARALATPVTADWTGLPLRPVADRLSDIGGMAVVIDRRLDPDTLITLEASAEPLEHVLARVADAAQAEVALYAGHVRIVPRGKAAALAAAERLRADELRAFGKPPGGVVGKRAEWSWPDGAVPRDLVASAAAEAGLVIEGLEHLPHDHLPSAHLPPCTLADRLDLLLAHFDRRVAWKRRSQPPGQQPEFSLVELPQGATAPSTAPRQPPPRPPRPPNRTASTYTLTVAAPLDELLATLARRFGLTLDLDRAALTRAGVAPAEIVRLELKDVSREQLLEAICAARGLAWRIEGDALSVSVAPR